jgi:hypothetical protein
LTLEKVLQTAGDAIGQVTQEDWMGFCQHVESLRKQCWEKNVFLPYMVDSVLMNLIFDQDSEGNPSTSEHAARRGLTPTRE